MLMQMQAFVKRTKGQLHMMSCEAIRELTAIEIGHVAGGTRGGVACVNVAGVAMPGYCAPQGFWASGQNYINGYGPGATSISIQFYQDVLAPFANGDYSCP
jgi:hypothetical protein